MDKHPIGDLMETTMRKIREMIDANTIVGEPISTPDGITLIPVSKVNFGFMSGGTDFQTKNQAPAANNSFGGGIGAGVNITPIAFIVVKGDSARMLHMSPPASGTLDRVVEMVPEIFDKITDMFDKDKTEESC